MRSKRPAFVLNELAVALTVLVLLGGLLCHTVQRVCVASERTRSVQRLKQAARTRPAERPQGRGAPISLTKANHPFAKDR